MPLLKTRPVEDDSCAYALWRPLRGEVELILSHRLPLFVGQPEDFQNYCSGVVDAARRLLSDETITIDGFFRHDDNAEYFRLDGHDGNGCTWLTPLAASESRIPVGKVAQVEPLAPGDVDPRD